MALSLSITLDSGVVVTYHTLINCFTDYINSNQQFTLASFISESAFTSRDSYLDSFNFTMEGTSNTLTEAYTQVETYSKYSGATTV